MASASNLAARGTRSTVMLDQFMTDVSRGGMSVEQQLSKITSIALNAINDVENGKAVMQLLSAQVDRLYKEAETAEQRERVLTIVITCGIGIISGGAIAGGIAFAKGATAGYVLAAEAGGALAGGCIGCGVGYRMNENATNKAAANRIQFLKELKEKYEQQAAAMPEPGQQGIGCNIL